MKLAVIGNGGGGKTTLSRRLSQLHDLPLTHVDTIQYLPGMKKRNEDQTRAILNSVADEMKWLIDGFGPWDVMERRFRFADHIIFVDFPLWHHYWWCLKRQIKSIWQPRSELPQGCQEATLKHTFVLFKILWRVHREFRPKFLKLFSYPDMARKTIHVRNMKQWQELYAKGFRDFTSEPIPSHPLSAPKSTQPP